MNRQRFGRLTIGAALSLMVAAPALVTAPGCGSRSTAPRAPGTLAAGTPAGRVVPQRQTIRAAELGRFAGSEQCLSCHPGQAGQSDTHHAHTLQRVQLPAQAPRFRAPSGVTDPTFGLTYHAGVEDGQCVLRATGGGSDALVAAEYAFGSGNLGVTYVGRYEDHPVELRLSYFSREKRWDYTPSQQPGARIATPVGRALDPETERGCFLCHSTALVEEAGQLEPGRSLFGVTCESCHGPGQAHIQAVKSREPDLRMADLSEARAGISEELCGQCHRTAGSNDVHNPMTRSQLPRLQGLALAQSRCFTESAGRLSCITCHDPHRDADRTSHAEYNRQCVSCHSSSVSHQVSCPRSPKGDCVSCHMPAQEVDIPTRPRYRTHWIRVWDTKEPPASTADSPTAPSDRAR